MHLIGLLPASTLCVFAGNAGLRGNIGSDGSSSDPVVKWWGWLLIALAILSVLGLLLAALYMCHRLRQRKLRRPAENVIPPLTKKVLLPPAHVSPCCIASAARLLQPGWPGSE